MQQKHHLPVGKRRDDQAAVVAEILVAVKLYGVDHFTRDRSGFSRKGRATASFPVVPELR